MNIVFRRLFAALMVAGVWGFAVSAQLQNQTGPVIIPRDRTSPSIHEGLTGRSSAGFKTNVNAYVGQLFASYIPFHGVGRAIGSLVTPFGIAAPIPSDPSSYGYKPTVQPISRFFDGFKNGQNRLFAGTKGIGGKNVTDVGLPGVVGGTGPGDLYWVGFPRPANPQQANPPVFQQPAHAFDCFCRYNEQVFCPMPGPLLYIAYGGFMPGPVACQACFAGFIVKHDFYVGTDHGTHWGYPTSFPADPGYRECLRQNQGDPSGGSPGNFHYGL